MFQALSWLFVSAVVLSPQELVSRVEKAAAAFESQGEAALAQAEFQSDAGVAPQDEFYFFLVDRQGKFRIHPTLRGQTVPDLTDLNGKLIVRGLWETVEKQHHKGRGFFHYEWPVPNGILPRWKSSYVRQVTSASGESLLLGAGVYSDDMQPEFITQMVDDAVEELSENGKNAFARFHDKKGPYWAKDAYIFILDEAGTDLVNPGFPTLEGRNILDVQDVNGKRFVKEMIEKVKTQGSGFVEYFWPRPGDNRPLLKSTYVKKAILDGKTLIVGCGVYRSDTQSPRKPSVSVNANDVIRLVRRAAKKLAKEGSNAFSEFRRKDSVWFHDNTYLFVWNLDGVRLFHAANPEIEGQNVASMKDIENRPIGQFILDAAKSPSGEGWAHCLYPEPKSFFPIWKSSFVKRVTFPDGKDYLVGSGAYQMPLDKTLVQELVQRAGRLIETEGTRAFDTFRNKTGAFYFMDTYVFVDTLEGIERVNPAQPTLEGRNLQQLRDAQGKDVEKMILKAARQKDGGWVTYSWYRPSQSTPDTKHTFVKTVQSPDGTFIVGSGYYGR